MGRYLSGLCTAGLGLCGGGWLIVTAVLLGGAPSDATLVNLATGAAVALVSVVALGCWSLAWRQRMRRDGVLRAQSRPPSPRQARRRRRALRREMRRAAKNPARPGPGSSAARSARSGRSARPDTGITGLGLGGASIADLVPDPRAPVTPPALHPRGGERSIPPGERSTPPAKGGRPAFNPPSQGNPAQTARPLGLPPQTRPEDALADPGSPPPGSALAEQHPHSPAAPSAAACPSPSAADAATLVAELRAILEPLLAASGEGEEAW